MSWPAERPSASQAGLSSVELVNTASMLTA